MSIADIFPPRRRLRPWVRLALALAGLALAAAGLALVLVPQRPAAPQKVILCGHTYEVPAGDVLNITGFGPHCTAVITGGQ